MEGEDSDNEQAYPSKGEALNLENNKDFNDSEDIDDAEDDDENSNDQKPTDNKKNSGSKGKPDQKDVKGEKLENQPYDLAVDVNDSEEIESEEEDDDVDMNDVGRAAQSAAQQTNQNQQHNKPQALEQAASKAGAGGDDEDDDDKEVPGTYNPAEYNNLNVGQEVKDLFEYIQRYKPQKIELETKLKPFIPDFVPAVGEVDACLKMTKPDGTKEDLGITQLDEPALNCEDKTVLELKYVQSKNVVRSAPITVDMIENADKKPKDITRWINSVQDLHKTRPAPSVNYTKQMPNWDELMSELSPQMESALKDMQFPGAEIDMYPADYSKLVLAMLDIPVHKLANNKSLIESLHVLFTLFSEFRQNQHFKNQGADGAAGDTNLHQF